MTIVNALPVATALALATPGHSPQSDTGDEFAAMLAGFACGTPGTAVPLTPEPEVAATVAGASPPAAATVQLAVLGSVPDVVPDVVPDALPETADAAVTGPAAPPELPTDALAAAAGPTPPPTATATASTTAAGPAAPTAPSAQGPTPARTPAAVAAQDDRRPGRTPAAEPVPVDPQLGIDDAAADPIAPSVAAPIPPSSSTGPAPVVADGAVAAPLIEVRTAASAAPAAPAPPPVPPATQIVSQLAPVLEGPDGTYTMSLQLYPEELGAVQVEISLRSGEVSVALHAADDVSTELLRAALPQLREQLEASGLTATEVSVDSGKSGRQDDEPPGDAAAQRRDRRPGAGTGQDVPAAAPAPDADATSLDVRM